MNSQPKKGNDDDDEDNDDDLSEEMKEEKKGRFIGSVCVHQPISYSFFGTFIQVGVVYIIYCKAAWCLNVADLVSGSNPPSFHLLLSPGRYIYSWIFPPNLSLVNIATCPSRPFTFYQLCLNIQFSFYVLILALRLAPPSKIVSKLDRFAHTFLLPVVNASVWLPWFIIPRSRVSYNPLAVSSFASGGVSPDAMIPAAVSSIWNLYGLLSLLSWSSSAFSSSSPSSKIVVPGLSHGTVMPTSFWGSWVFGGLYTGPILVWWLFNLCNRSAIGFYNWEMDQTISTANEHVQKFSGPAPEEFDGRMDGGRTVGWLRRMWVRFSGVLVYSLWLLLLASPQGDVSGSIHSSKLFVGVDVVPANMRSLWLNLWMWGGVLGTGILFAIWLNFLNYQHRLVVWKDEGRTAGVLIDEEDDELKVGLLY
ncbi:hypothetical protein BDR26DRAFT_641229 [Obelidium mucronatum]|nr:hypothetical protein BDR26DRAFT_641229 [Obelidium mucronatum]